jgi:hypothetical protein
MVSALNAQRFSQDAKIVMMTAEVPRTPAMSCAELFGTSADNRFRSVSYGKERLLRLDLSVEVFRLNPKPNYRGEVALVLN